MSIDDYADRLKKVGVLYVDVYPFCITKNGEIKYLTLKRKTDVELPGNWQGISGKIKKDESIKKAFFRQIKKKTGQEPEYIFKLDIVNTFYDDYYDTVMLVPIAAAQIKESPIILSKDLHTEHKWLTLNEIEDYYVWPKQIECIHTINKIMKSKEKEKNTMFRKLEK